MSIAQKIPLSRSLNAFAEQKALNEIEKTGRALPGHVTAVNGAIVTVSFDVTGGTFNPVTMPLFGPEYIRYPVQVGDKGYAMAADAYLGAVSGLGKGVADITYQRGNLSTLVWMPIGNKNWTAVTENFLVVYGPDGVIIQDVATASPTTFLKVTTGQIQLTAGGKTLTINASGITLDGILWETHDHGPGTYVAGSTPVTGDSGGPL